MWNAKENQWIIHGIRLDKAQNLEFFLIFVNGHLHAKIGDSKKLELSGLGHYF